MIRQANTLLVILVTFLAGFWLRFPHQPLPPNYLIALLLTLVLSLIVFPATGSFRREFEWAFVRKLRRLLAAWTIVILVLVSLAAMLKITSYFSRIWFGSWVLLCYFGLIVMLLVSHYAAVLARRRGKDSRDIVLVGAGETARNVDERIAGDPYSGMNLLARFGRAWSDNEVRPIEELAAFIDTHAVREVWIAVPWEDKALLEQSLGALKESVVDVNVVPDLDQYRLLNQGISEWGGLPVISLAGTPMTESERLLKAIMDWVVAFLITVLLSPVLLGVALLILLTDGRPVLYRQPRHGIGGESIEILKFRTMKVAAPGAGFRQAEPGDERVIPFGRFLRRTSLDELPQLFNVLKGEMSLVGPRPHPLELNDDFKSRIPRYMLRHKVKPGITGWAQVNGYRGQTETREKMALRIEHDLWYIQNWSMWLDFRILLMTPFVMMHRNAY
jgi:Undecaprenyl-phosphate glucose phosphotransferase